MTNKKGGGGGWRYIGSIYFFVSKKQEVCRSRVYYNNTKNLNRNNKNKKGGEGFQPRTSRDRFEKKNKTKQNKTKGGEGFQPRSSAI